MVESVHRDVFKIENQDNPIRFGAKFIETAGLEEKWTGEIPEMDGIEKNQLIGSIISNSEGKKYKVNKITEGNPEGKDRYHQKYFWIEGV